MKRIKETLIVLAFFVINSSLSYSDYGGGRVLNGGNTLAIEEELCSALDQTFLEGSSEMTAYAICRSMYSNFNEFRTCVFLVENLNITSYCITRIASF